MKRKVQLYLSHNLELGVMRQKFQKKLHSEAAKKLCQPVTSQQILFSCRMISNLLEEGGDNFFLKTLTETNYTSHMKGMPKIKSVHLPINKLYLCEKKPFSLWEQQRKLFFSARAHCTIVIGVHPP